MKSSFNAITSVATKEFLHILRDRRIVALILVLPPFFTLLFGHAFEVTERQQVPAILLNADQGEASTKLVDFLNTKEKFKWLTELKDKSHESYESNTTDSTPDLFQEHAEAAIIIPAGWSDHLKKGDPVPLRLILDGADTTTARELEGSLQQFLGEHQKSELDEMVADLPENVIALGKQLPVDIRKQFVSAMTPWTLKSEILYNPKLRFIEYVIPGIIGLILQLLTVTLMACTLTREREAGTLSQLMVTSLRRAEIVVGKVLPYLVISTFLIAETIAVAYFHFNVKFYEPMVLGGICLLFLLCSLGLGLLISAFCDTQTQAIQFAVFFLLPVFPLSGAFAPLEQLPDNIRMIPQLFPLTHFCHAFRLINLYHANFQFIAKDLIFLALGAVITCGGAAVLLSRSEE